MDKKIISWLVVPFLVMIIPLIYQYINSQKSLSVSLVSNDTIISPSEQIDGISIKYNDDEVSHLSKNILLIENTGSIAIKNDDIIIPLSIDINKKIKVYDIVLGEKIPKDIDASISKENSRAIIKFSLLNPEDKIYINILSDAIDTIDFSATARITDIKNITLKKEINDRNIFFSIFLWCLVIISLLFLLTSFFGFSHSVRELRLNKKLIENSIEIPIFHAKEDYLEWLNTYFSHYTLRERNYLAQTLLNNNDQDTNLKRINIILEAKKSFTSNIPPSIFIFIMSLVGFYFSFQSLNFF